jgi:hypothetical protein
VVILKTKTGKNPNIKTIGVIVLSAAIILFLVFQNQSVNSIIQNIKFRNGSIEYVSNAKILNNTIYTPQVNDTVSTNKHTTTVTGRIEMGITCFPQPGYFCLKPILASSTGNLSVRIGQATGEDWNNVSVVFVTQAVPTYQGIPEANWSSPNASYIAYLASGSYSNITLPVISHRIGNGTMINGTIWVRYHVNDSNSTVQYAGIAAGHFLST